MVKESSSRRKSLLLNRGTVLPVGLAEWKHQQCRQVTVVWCALLSISYASVTWRIPLRGNFIPWALVACIQFLLCLVVAAALKGTPAQLKASISAVWLIRVLGYLMVGFNCLSSGFSTYLSAQQHLSIMFGPILFNSIALVHLPKPYLYLGVQACAIIASYMRLGMPMYRAAAQSATLHLMIVVIHQLTERGFRSTFSAMVQSQGSCKGALAGATSDQQALQEAPLEKAGSPPASKAPPCPAPAPPSCYGSVKGSKKSVTGMLLSTDSKEGNILSPGSDVLTPGETGAASKGSEVINGRGEHGVESRGSEASRDSHRLVSERMHSSVAAGAVRAGPGRPKYKKQFQVHKLVLKVPGSAHPQSLPPTALPDLATLIHERSDTCFVANAAVRYGCVLVTLDLQHSILGSPIGPQLSTHLVEAVQAWLQSTQLAAELTPGSAVSLQVGELVLSMVVGADAKSWSVQSLTMPSQPGPGMACKVTAASPALLLPVAPLHTTGTATSYETPELPPSKGPMGRSVTLHASVCVPAHMSRLLLKGWGGDAGQETASERSSNLGIKEEPLQVLVNVLGHGYVPTTVRILPASPSTSHAAAENATQYAVEINVSLPATSAEGNCPCLLTLELWRQDRLLSAHSCSNSCVLILPGCMPGAADAAEELQHGLPWRSEDSTDLKEFMRDLGYWVVHNRNRHLVSKGAADGDAAAQAGAGPSAWGLGVALLRQSMLWGLPALSTLLVETLMSLPSAPSMPFAQLAHAQEGYGPARTATASTTRAIATGKTGEAGEKPSLEAVEGVSSGDGAAGASELGSLLHWALLCPSNSRAMLQAVLEWGRRWGCQHTQGEAGGGSNGNSSTGGTSGFAWAWAEPNVSGFSALDILASLPAESEVLDVEVEHPHGSEVLVVCARDLLQRCKPGGSNTDSVICGQRQLQPHQPSAQLEGQPKGNSSANSSSTGPTSGAPCAQEASAEPPLLKEQRVTQTSQGLPEWVSHLLCLLRASLTGSQQMCLGSTSTKHSCASAAATSTAAAPASPAPSASAQQGGKISSSTGDAGGGASALGPSCKQTVAPKSPAATAPTPSPCTADVAPLFRETEFRAWLNTQAAPMALYWCTFQTLNCMAGMVRVAVTKGLWALLLELYGFGTFFPAYAGGAYFIWKAPKHSEAICVGIILCRALCCFMQGMGWLPIITSIRIVLGLNLDAVVDILLMSSMEQVRVRWMMPLRLLMVVCYSFWYMQAGKQHPWIRAAAVSACGFAVNVALDMRYRHLFSLRLHRLAHSRAGPEASDTKFKQT